MSLSGIAIRRPVFTVMVVVALMVFGIVGLKRLGTDLFPDVSLPVVAVNIVYPGASPNEVEQLVTKQIEDSVVSLNGIDRMQSFSREGLSTTVVMFKLGVDIQEAATSVRERVAQTRFKLPQEIKEPAISRFDVSSAPIMTYTVSGDGRSLEDNAKFARDVIKPAIEQVDGVASVEVRGGAKREIHVDLDLARIDSLRMSPVDVINQIKAAGLTVPAGHFDEGAKEVAVRTVGEFRTLEDIRSLIVATAQDGSPVRLTNVAEVRDGFEELRTKIRVNGQPAVSFDVMKQSGRNTVAISDSAVAKLAKMKADFPPGVRTDLIIDQAQFIKENVHEVEMSIFFGGAMAILVILLFMLDMRSTLISAVALPTSVVSTFFVMYALNFTLNMMTLLGLSLAIGLLIDDAVVVRENITKFLERGVPPREAAEKGTEEIALSVLATTLTICAVFVPVAFMSGMVGQFFKQFGLTICAAVLMSLFVAFTLDPMLSSRFSKAHDASVVDPYARIKAPFQRMFKAIDDTYFAILRWSIHHRKTVAGLAFGSFALMVVVLGMMGNEFVNAEDRGQFKVNIELPAGTSLTESARLTLEAEKKVLDDKNFITVLSTLGQSGDTNVVEWRIVAKKKADRNVGLASLKKVARDLALGIPGAKVAVADPEFIEGAATRAPIMVQVRGPSFDVLEPLSNQYAKALRAMPGVGDVQVKYSPGRPELRVGIDREKAAALGVPAAQIAMTLRAALEGEEAVKLRAGKDEVPVRVRLLQSDRGTVQDVLKTTLWTPKGPVTVAEVAHVERGEGPNVIEREDRERHITIWAFPQGRPLGEIAREMETSFAAIKMPPGTSYILDGQIRDMNESNESMGLALLLAVIFIYIVLASQFESFVHPFTIMLTLPLALVGAIIALFLWGTTLAMGAMIGIILLMGLVTKNAILLLDRALVRAREMGEPTETAILHAGPERLRPILMTSAAMILGMLPTALSNGDGSEFRAPMAVAVIGGVISSTFLSLIVVPAMYVSIENAKAWLARQFGLDLRGVHTVPPPPPGESEWGGE
ncbi:MAG: efflux RND transporter permease subunit [Polyangiaceae bacterium]|nr:efflux RND transporter permease subunit [Polyangiaceae bacterium]